MNWYLKKEYFDIADDIEAVTIHYTWTPLGKAPDWSAHRESRLMAAGEYLKTGVGEVSKYGPAAPAVPQHVHPKLRKKVLKMPNDIWDEGAGVWTGDYNLHYFYEMLQGGQTHYSPVYTDEIRTREVVVVDPLGVILGTCVNWSVQDWDAPQFSPTEDPEFLARYGEDHPLRALKFYGSAAGTEYQDAFGIAKKALLDRLPLPHRFATRISAPVGAIVRFRLHVGNMGLPAHQRWEDYWLDESFVMAPGLETLELTPLGTEVPPQPLSVVTPDVLVELEGTPYASFVPGSQPTVLLHEVPTTNPTPPAGSATPDVEAEKQPTGSGTGQYFAG